MREERDAIKSELGKKETAIATLQTELDNRLAEAARNEIFLTEELNRFKYGIVPSEEPCGEQLQLFPTPEELPTTPPQEELSGTSQPEPETETENTEPPAVAPEPITIQSEAPNTTTPPETDPGESELLTASQLAKKVNEKLEEIRKKNKEKGIDKNHNLPKTLKDYSLRDWFKKGSTCTDEYRALKQEEYGFKFSHCDKKGTLWFTVS